MTPPASAIAAALREQAHIDRRAPHTVALQVLRAARKGKRPPDIVRAA